MNNLGNAGCVVAHEKNKSCMIMHLNMQISADHCSCGWHQVRLHFSIGERKGGLLSAVNRVSLPTECWLYGIVQRLLSLGCSFA